MPEKQKSQRDRLRNGLLEYPEISGYMLHLQEKCEALESAVTYFLERMDAFDDTKEIVFLLRNAGDVQIYNTGTYPYIEYEAAMHLQCMWIDCMTLRGKFLKYKRRFGGE